MLKETIRRTKIKIELERRYHGRRKREYIPKCTLKMFPSSLPPSLLPELESKCFNRQLAKNAIHPKQGVSFFLSLLFIKILEFHARSMFPCGFPFCVNIQKESACYINSLDCKSLTCLFIRQCKSKILLQWELHGNKITRRFLRNALLICHCSRSPHSRLGKQRRHSLCLRLPSPSPAHPPG